MAKKSAASLSIVTPALGRPKAPAELTEAEAGIWDAVVSTKPAEWFGRDTYPLLVAYCRAVIGGHTIAAQIEAFKPEWLAEVEGLKRYDKLLAMQYRQGMLISTLATKMRLAQQSKYGARGAESHARASAAKKPWESPKSAER